MNYMKKVSFCVCAKSDFDNIKMERFMNIVFVQGKIISEIEFKFCEIYSNVSIFAIFCLYLNIFLITTF